MVTPEINELASDTYYQPAYSALYEDGAEYFEFCYQEESYYVKFSALKRRISSVLNHKLDEELYDLETPYGYGGPIANYFDEHFLYRAFSAYREHCRKLNIVCEFIRFHPFNPLAKSSSLFDMHFHERQVVVVDLENSAEERRKSYSKTTRNIVKKASTRLLVEESCQQIPDFMAMYYQTMKKNTASDFFYFDENYFHQLAAVDGVSLLAVKKEETYASIGFFMCGKELAHYHLSANNQELAKENGNYLLLDAAFDYAKRQGCRYMMLGGGRTSSTEDSLFKFKSKFSPLTLPFYIAGIDFLPEKREMLNQIWLEQNAQNVPPKLFQLYRA
ncbi:GNAT family N-acetyltransferase [Vibrio mediterranei]|jgi:hypothetical protein|uniref:GNAT family N-acetyltransferase n=1 Tax=Vibrio barjaei TaxID=1676683 RepID=A0ABW7IG09_9VIBR